MLNSNSINPINLALSTAKGVSNNTKKASIPSPSAQPPMQSFLNQKTQQPQAISTPMQSSIPKIWWISSPFGAPNINSAPMLWWATPQAIWQTAQQIKSLPKQLPQSWSEQGKVISRDKLREVMLKIPDREWQRIAMQKLIERWYTFEGVDTQESKWNFITDLWSWIAQSVASYGNLWKKAWMYVWNQLRPVFGKDKLTPEQLQNAWQENNIANQITNWQTPQQKESVWGIAWNVVWTIWQALVMPTWVWALSKVPAVANISAKAPVASAIVKWWLQWAIWQEQYNLATEWRTSTPWELALSAGVWAVIPWAVPLVKATKWAIAKWVDKLANKVYLSWLLNPKKLEYVAKALRETGDDVANVTDWMTKRGVKWSKETIVTQLDDLATKTRSVVKDTVAQLQWTVKNPSIKWALEEMIDAVWTPKSASQIAKLDELSALLQKHETTWLSRAEAQKVKESMDDLLWIYTIAGDVRAWQQKADLAWLRQDIRKLIEWAGESAGVDIKTLNRDTAVAKQLSNSINYKSKTDAVREMLSPFAPRAIWGVFWATQWDTPEERVMYWLAGFLWGQMLWSNLIKTNAWMLLKKAGWLMSKMTPQEKTYLVSILWNAIGKNSDNALSNVVNNSMTYNSIDDSISNLNDDLVWSINKKINAEIDNMKALPLKDWAIVFPWSKWQLGNTKPQPKTPPVIRETGVIWQPYKAPKPKINEVVTPKVIDIKPKVDTFNRLLELDSSKEYKKMWPTEPLWWLNRWTVYETEIWPITNAYYWMSPKIEIWGKMYDRSKYPIFKKLSSEEIKVSAIDSKASEALSELERIEKSPTSKSYWSNLKWVLQEMWISKVSEIPKWWEAEILKMVRARNPVSNRLSPKVKWDSWVKPKLGKEVMEQNPIIKDFIYHGWEVDDYTKLNADYKFSNDMDIWKVAAEWPWIYFTSSSSEANWYGSKVIKWLVSDSANIIDDTSKKLTRSQISSVIKKLPQDLKIDIAQNRDENINRWLEQAIDSLVDWDTPHDQLINIWADVFNRRDVKWFMDVANKLWIDWVKIKKPFWYHVVIYNKSVLDTNKNLPKPKVLWK